MKQGRRAYSADCVEKGYCELCGSNLPDTSYLEMQIIYLT